jgi:hypothetical protein
MARTIGAIATGFLVWWVGYGVALLVIGGVADAVRVDESVTTFLAAVVGGLGGGWVAAHAMRRIRADAAWSALVLPVGALAVLWVGGSALSAPSAEMLRFRVIAVLGIAVGFASLAWMAATGRVLSTPRRVSSRLSPAETARGAAILPALIWIAYLGCGLFQLFAIMDGLEKWLGLHWILAAPAALFLTYIPIVGSVVGVIGAVNAWGWTWLQAIGLFVAPVAMALAIGLMPSRSNG